LRAGRSGKTAILLRGRGAHLDLAPLPANQPVTVQIKNNDGTCWEAVYSAPNLRNDPERFQDRSD
jgi:hypothetical protein